jgi:sRNA-binding carbon storage regulator CsrA
MLVLTRKEKQSVILTLEDGREIKITLLKIRNPYSTEVSIGFLADPSISILREEIKDKKKKTTT